MNGIVADKKQQILVSWGGGVNKLNKQNRGVRNGKNRNDLFLNEQ